MTTWTLIRRSAAFYRRTHLGVFLGAIIGAAVLVGALAVGDSVRHSLRRIALARLGGVHLALSAEGRMFRAALADQIAEQVNAEAAPVLFVPGTAADPDAGARANNVNVLGVNEDFWRLGGTSLAIGPEDAVLNDHLAAQLKVEIGDVIVLRMELPGTLPRDAPLATVDDAIVAARLTVKDIVDDARFGRFSLRANHLPPFNLFVSLDWLQRRLDRPGRVNVLLVGGGAVLQDAQAALDRSFTLADAELELSTLDDGAFELRSDRVFIDTPVSEAALQLPEASGVMTYFVNELRVGDHATPYSIVSGIDHAEVDEGVTINQWLADDLDAKVGDELTMTYYVVGPMRTLEEKSAAFRVSHIVPIAGWAADPTLMPAFPGLADAENCRDWEPGFDIDLSRIRDKDEAYWDLHRGTPKAFLPLDTAQQLWGNRFGNLTAVRSQSGTDIATTLLESLDPSTFGLTFRPVRQTAMDAASQSFDFGPLFIGFSLFLIVSALLLMGLLFIFGVEQRSEQVGLLLAVGYAPGRIRRLLLIEGLVLAIPGCLIGMLVGLAYTRAVLWALSTVWRDAVGATALGFAVTPGTLLGGGVAGVVLALLTIWLAVRRRASHPPRELLAMCGGGDVMAAPRRPWISWVVLGLALIGAIALLVTMKDTFGRQQAGAFFGAGALLLTAGLAACSVVMAHLARASSTTRLTTATVGRRNLARRRGRSLATISLLAVGCFMLVAVQAFRHDPNAHARERTSGTGGFALVGESTLPIYEFDAIELPGVAPLRVRTGDDASCLNLNRAQQPRLLGVDPDTLASRGAFSFVDTLFDADHPWQLLRRDLGEPDIIPAITDQPTLVWALGRKLGDTIDYTDERGRTFRVKIVAVIDTSILQGNLLISEDTYVERFPSDSGYQMLLIDAPQDQAEAVSASLSRAMQDQGLQVTPASQRLAQFLIVENTYLSIFQALGGLGLLLGTAGLAVVVLRNLLERRGELAALRAIGYSKRTLRRMILSEHALLLALGMLCGVIAAAVAPALTRPGADLPYASTALLLASVALIGLICVASATTASTRGPTIDALREE